MKKFTALLLLVAMLLPACSGAGENTDESASVITSSSSTVVTTAELSDPSVPTDTDASLATTADTPVTDDTPVTTTAQTPETEVPVTTTTAETPTTDTPVTTEPTTSIAPETSLTTVETSVPTTSPNLTTTAPVTTAQPPVTDTPVAHTHSYGAWKISRYANCVEEGERIRTCSCGEKETESIAPNGKHTWKVWTTVVEAKVDAEGVQMRTCRYCDASETQATAKLAPALNNLFPIDNAVHATLLSSSAGGFNDREKADSLFDSAPYTKLCTDNVNYTIEWKLDEKTRIFAYSLVMGNDTRNYDRRPTAWTLEASENGKNWTLVSNVTNGDITKENYYEKLFAIEEGEYQYFRFTLKAPTSGMTQMSEINLYTNEVPKTPALKNQLSADQLAKSANMTAGLDLVKRTIDDYYNRDTHRVGEQPGATGATTIWPATSFIESVAEAYRACPDDPYIYSTYVDLLNNCLSSYRVQATITTPSGTYNDVVFYTAGTFPSPDWPYDYYYDDDAWVCIQYINAYELLGDKRYLELAEELLEFFWTGWDEKLGGGIYWDKSFGGKNTCSDGPIAIAYLRAYELTGKQEYLDKGIAIYDWLREVLLQNNLYADNIDINGKISDWKAAYNQGTPMAAGALLYRITGDKKYYNETTAVWNATINHMFRGNGSNTTMNGNPIFRAWCIGWLVRGFEMYYMVDDAKQTTAMDKMLSVLEDERGTINYQGREGYYDPYFLTGDWAGESKTEILQPSGVATTFLLAGFYEVMN